MSSEVGKPKDTVRDMFGIPITFGRKVILTPDQYMRIKREIPNVEDVTTVPDLATLKESRWQKLAEIVGDQTAQEIRDWIEQGYGVDIVVLEEGTR